DWLGFEYIWVKVFDDDSAASPLDTLTIQVVDQTVPPQIQSLPIVEFDEDESSAHNLDDYVTDADNDNSRLYWQITGGDSVQAVINPNTHVAIFSAYENWFGQETLKVKVTDPDGNADSTSVQVEVNSVNDAPVFYNLPNVNLSENKSKSIDLKNYSMDIDNPYSDLNWEHDQAQNIIIDIDEDNGIANFSVSQDWNGRERITLYVSDIHGQRDTATTWVYSQNEQNAPQISAPDTIQIWEDHQRQLELDPMVTDPDDDNDELTWLVSTNGPIELDLNDDTRILTLMPPADWNGQNDIFLQAEDPNGNIAFDTLQVHVLNINDKPVVDHPGDIFIYENTTYSLNLKDYIWDGDGYDDLETLELEPLRGNNSFIGFYLDRHSLYITFFAPPGYMGRETFQLKVIDKAGEAAQTTFGVEVSLYRFVDKISIGAYGSPTVIRVEWNTLQASRDFIQYGPSLPYDSKTPIEDALTTEHETVIADLKPEQSYAFRIVSERANGQISYSQDTTFTTGSLSNEINVFPIPFRASAMNHQSDGISFTNLPSNAQILIFNVLGELVFKTDTTAPLFRWPVVNDSGKEVHSGVYLYVIKEGNKKTASGKLIVIR
ncbi:MAG: T9SS type A sorting domain-containing protein, partial [Caldithrix sp.]|nr:T9SS type A sorting domain-containing protein [Caldithrix sp.]